MARVPRHVFVPDETPAAAYGDHPLEIGFDQTISQPYIVARMVELAEAGPGRRVLEIGAGCGYQTAILAELGAEVYAVEIHPALADAAARRLERLGYANVHLRQGDGRAGWPGAAPFDAIVLAAAPESIPPALPPQLTDGGRLVAPVGPQAAQKLIVLQRREGQLVKRTICGVRFVPLLGDDPAIPE
jgi:protein-L-isoaspartate(D-aspartate) O-methyltransferase